MERLQDALNCIYHNATLPHLCDLEDVEGGLELKSLLDAGHNPRNGYNRAPSDIFHDAVYDAWLDTAQQEAVAALAATLRGEEGGADWGNLTSPYGRVYQWGRGGRTLAPEAWVRQRGGGSFSIKTAGDFDDVEDMADVEALTVRVEAFNAAVDRLRKALPEWWAEYLGEQVGEKLEEVTLAHQQAQAAEWAANFYAAAQQVRPVYQHLNLKNAAACYAYANGHPNALPWADIQALAPIVNS